MTQLRVYTLGPPRLERGGQPVDLGLRKVMALIVYLAVTDQPHSRDHLAALLWPEHDQREARGRIRRTLHRVTEVLGPAVLASDGDHVRIRAELDLWLDCAAFRAEATAGLPASPAHALAAPRLAHLAAAVELYSADFLDGFTLPDSPAFDEWQFFQRESLHQLYGQVLEQLVRAHLGGDQLAEAIPYARRWVALDPLHEPAQRTLIQLYASSGQHSAAIRQYQECARVLDAELGATPEPETIELYEAIRTRRLDRHVRQAEAPPAPLARTPAAGGAPTASDDPSLHGERGRVTPPPLPASLRQCIGRERELVEIGRLIVAEPDCRLLTLTGPGGIGKTRLALEAAAGLTEVFPDGVCVVELAPLTDASQVPEAVAHTLGIHASSERPIVDALAGALRERRLLLVLDNCEHLVVACARLAEHLLHACPGLQILATSREALGLTGETTLPVPPLAHPDAARLPPLDELVRYDAVRLFVARAQAVLPGFQITAANAVAVAQICAQLDGIPLAIELAAARARLLRVEQIAARLGDRFRLLTSGSRTALPRHQTLRALIDWSHELLTEPERRLFAHLAVFAGGWTLAAVEAIEGDDALELLNQLVNKSLVVVDHGRGAEVRYHLLETIREYALARLEERGEVDALRQRHAEYYGGLARAAAPEWTFGIVTREESWTELDAERENLRVALHWSLASGAPDIGAPVVLALLFLWIQPAILSDGRRWVEGVLARLEPGDSRRALRGQLLLAAGALAVHQGDAERGGAAYAEACAIARELGDTPTIAWTLDQLGYLAYIRGDAAAATAAYEESLALRRQRGDMRRAAWALFGLGVVSHDLGSPERSPALLAESLALLRQLDDPQLLAQMLLDQGSFLRYGRDPARGQALLSEALELGRRIGDRPKIARALRELGAAARDANRDAEALALLQEALALFRSSGDRFGIAETLHNLAEASILGGDDARAWELAQEALRTWRELVGTIEAAGPLQNLGRIMLHRGDYAAARSFFLEALRLLQATRHRLRIALCLEDLAGVAIAAEPNPQGAERAARLLGAAEALREIFRFQPARIQCVERERTIAAARQHLSSAAWAQAWAEGPARPLDELLAEPLALEAAVL